MGGPATGIIVSGYQPDPVLAIIGDVFEKCGHKYFEDWQIKSTLPIGGRIDGHSCPLGCKVESAIETEWTGSERAALAAFLGDDPDLEVSLWCYSNREDDHRILGELTAFLAQRLSAIINLDGTLQRFGAAAPERGRLVEIPYETAAGVSAYHCCDAEFLYYWLTQSDFHLI